VEFVPYKSGPNSTEIGRFCPKRLFFQGFKGAPKGRQSGRFGPKKNRISMLKKRKFFTTEDGVFPELGNLNGIGVHLPQRTQRVKRGLTTNPDGSGR
jgi:hypothetical protein